MQVNHDGTTTSPGVTPGEGDEVPGYFPCGSDQVYYVHHQAIGTRRGGVVIAPPFASERSDSYLTCVRWARQLARTGFDVLRFDYRGTGESSGKFRFLDLNDRREDVRSSVQFLRSRIGDSPLILHGMRLGAVFVSELFAEGVGDGLLLWAPPASAQDHLWEVLRFTLAADMVQGDAPTRRTREDCIAELESGGEVNVGGYFWNLKLWTSAANHPLRLPGPKDHRPWRAVDVRFKVNSSSVHDPHRHQVVCGRFWEESLRMTADVSVLCEDGEHWMQAVGVNVAPARRIA
jgi:alpha/beta superfamily hydrolase